MIDMPDGGTDVLPPEAVGERYDDLGWLYDLILGGNLHIGWFDDEAPGISPSDRMTDVLIGRTPVAGGDAVLDLGCGTGRPAVRLAEATGCSVTGVTVSADQVRSARVRAEAAGLEDRVRFEVADAYGLPFPDASFDAVWAVETFMYLGDREAAMSEVRRVLRPGGTLVLADYVEREGAEFSDDERRTLMEGYTVTSFPRSVEYAMLMAGAGLRMEECVDATSHLRRFDASVRRVISDNLGTVGRRAGDGFAREFAVLNERLGVVRRHHLGYLVCRARG